jgi:hypothetical protein
MYVCMNYVFVCMYVRIMYVIYVIYVYTRTYKAAEVLFPDMVCLHYIWSRQINAEN